MPEHFPVAFSTGQASIIRCACGRTVTAESDEQARDAMETHMAGPKTGLGRPEPTSHAPLGIEALEGAQKGKS